MGESVLKTHSREVSSAATNSVPLPLALGGIGLLLAIALPGGRNGGGGFLLGFLTGLAVLAVTAVLQWVKSTVDRQGTEVSCPRCGHDFTVSLILEADRTPRTRDTKRDGGDRRG